MWQHRQEQKTSWFLTGSQPGKTTARQPEQSCCVRCDLAQLAGVCTSRSLKQTHTHTPHINISDITASSKRTSRTKTGTGSSMPMAGFYFIFSFFLLIFCHGTVWQTKKSIISFLAYFSRDAIRYIASYRFPD